MHAVQIKSDSYGKAIMTLVRLGGTFQTKYKDTLIVNGKQKQILEEAGFVKSNSSRKVSNGRGEKKA